MTPTRGRIYISGPMTGIPQFNFPVFDAAAAHLRDLGLEVVSPAELDAPETREAALASPDGAPGSGTTSDETWADFLARDVKLIADEIDAVALLPDWHKSRGARLETFVARLCGRPVYRYTPNEAELLTPLSDAELDEVLGYGDPGLPSDDAATKSTNPKDVIGSAKMPMHLWPTTATLQGALALLDGALKYGRSNWRESGVRYSVYYDAARRHLDAAFEGEDEDPDSGLPHEAHVLACLAIIVDARAVGKLIDDRAYRGDGYRDAVTEATAHVARLKEKHKDRTPQHYTIAGAA